MYEDTRLFIDWLKESALHFEKTKKFSQKVREYYNGDQLDEFIKRVLANRGQPEQYENQIAKHNNSILGFKQERDVEIRLFGTQQQDKPSADMLNALIKSITQVSDYDDEIEALDDELAIEGISVAELSIKATGEYDSFGREHKDVEINHVPAKEIFLDPASKSKNYNDDARYITRAFWIDSEDLAGLGFDEEKIRNLTNINFISDVVEDDLHLDENIRGRVLLCYTWYRKYDKESKQDKYYYSFWSNTTILLQGESPYDFKGFPYEVAFMNRDFSAKIKYWGLYRHVMPLQDSLNQSKLKLQNMIYSNKTLINRGALIDEDIEQFAEEYSLDNAMVMVEDVNGIKDIKLHAQIQQVLGTIIDTRNQIAELLNSNKEMLGTANNRMSAVGQEQRIQTGLVGLSKFVKASDKLQKRIIKKMVRLIEQYYDTERVVSMIDEDYMQDFITINQAKRDMNGGIEYEVLEDGSVTPLSQNAIKIGKYDLIFSAKPKSATMSAERMRQNVELLKVLQSTDPELVKYLVPDILKDSDSPSANKIRDIINQRDSQKQESPESQMVAQMQAENERLNLILKQSQANLNNARAKAMEDKNKIDLQKAFSRSVIEKENIQARNNAAQLANARRQM